MAKPVPDSDATAPVLSRHHAAGASSARGLLFTVLGEFVLPADQPVWTATFLSVLGRLGIEEKAARQALMRTATDGWLVSERIGRRTRWHLTNDAVGLLTEGTERIFSFTGAQQNWDGRWLTVHARVPERDRATRHLLRSRLAWAGFGNPALSLWISTHTERRSAVDEVISEAGLRDDALIFEGRLVGGPSPAALVAQAWDLNELESRYRGFVSGFVRKGSADALIQCTELVDTWRRFPWVDPALPQELLPPDWHGNRAAEVFSALHERWANTARAEWASIADQG